MPSLTYPKKHFLNKKFQNKLTKDSNLLSITGTSTACKVFGLNLDPGFKAPHPAAQPNLPKKSSFLSGKQTGAKNIFLEIFYIKQNNK